MTVHIMHAPDAQIGLPVVVDLLLLQETGAPFTMGSLTTHSFLAHRHRGEQLKSEEDVNYYLIDFTLQDGDELPELDKPIWVHARIRGFYYADGPFPEKIRQSLEVVAWSYRREEIEQAYDSNLMDGVMSLLVTHVRKGSGSSFGIAGFPKLDALESPKAEQTKPVVVEVALDQSGPEEHPSPPVVEPVSNNVFDPNEDDGIPFDQSGPGWATDMEVN